MLAYAEEGTVGNRVGQPIPSRLVTLFR